MKAKIVIIVQFLIIIALAAALLTRYISFFQSGPVIREALTPNESTLSYTPPPPPAFPAGMVKDILKYREAFTPTVQKITEKIYLAWGFALGNMAMIITDDGLVVVDATESRAVAGKIMQEFGKITDLPVKYVIYTHFHRDHVFGTPAFYKPGVEVIATDEAVRMMDVYYGTLQPFVERSRVNQAGGSAPEFAPELPFEGPFKVEAKRELIRPTITFTDHYSFESGGTRFELRHTMGETTDHLMIWMPKEKALFSGDLVYASFPNLSTPMLESRPVRRWFESLDEMIAMRPEYLIPSHGVGLIGEEEIRSVLIPYSRAVRYVYEETVKAINQGLTVNQAVARIRLPRDLAAHPYLQEYYGRVDWSVRGIYRSITGWYDGRGTGLAPLPPDHLAVELITLAGGADKLLTRAVVLQKKGEHQLVCEICDVVIRANPREKIARVIKASSLDALGLLCGNMNMFGFYRSAAALEREAAGYKP